MVHLQITYIDEIETSQRKKAEIRTIPPTNVAGTQPLEPPSPATSQCSPWQKARFRSQIQELNISTQIGNMGVLTDVLTQRQILTHQPINFHQLKYYN